MTLRTSTPSALRGVLVLAHRDEPGAEAPLLDRPHDHERDRDQRKHDPIERRAALELERLRPQVELDQVPTPAPVIGATLARMRSTSAKASVTRAKYEPLKPERKRQRADHRADERAGGDAEHEAGPGVDAVARLQDGGDIGAGTEEGRMAEGVLPAIAAEHVPALAHERDQQRDDQEVEHDVRGTTSGTAAAARRR